MKTLCARRCQHTNRKRKHKTIKNIKESPTTKTKLKQKQKNHKPETSQNPSGKPQRS